MCQCTLFDVGGVEIHSIECIEYCTKDQSNVEHVEDTLYRFQLKAMYVEGVEDNILSFLLQVIIDNFWTRFNVQLTVLGKESNPFELLQETEISAEWELLSPAICR